MRTILWLGVDHFVIIFSLHFFFLRFAVVFFLDNCSFVLFVRVFWTVAQRVHQSDNRRLCARPSLPNGKSNAGCSRFWLRSSLRMCFGAPRTRSGAEDHCICRSPSKTLKFCGNCFPYKCVMIFFIFFATSPRDFFCFSCFLLLRFRFFAPPLPFLFPPSFRCFQRTQLT